MFGNLHSVLQTKCQLDKSRPILVGVSGGADSLCLLDVLYQLGYQPIIAHLNHRLRPEAESETREIEKIASRLDVQIVLDEKDVGKFARDNALSVEEAARILRYRFLFEQAKRYDAQAVAVGHNADDQVETVLMHLLRGSGLAGLTGMAYRSTPTQWSINIPLVRPFLGIWREEIHAYLADRGLHPTLDSSNLDTTYYRNRLRHDLIPYLEGYNPQVRQIIWRTINILKEDHNVLEIVIGEAWQDCLQKQGKGYVGLNVKSVKDKPTGIQRHVIRRAIAEIKPGLRDIDFETIRRGVAFLAEPVQTGQCELTAGLRMLVEGKSVWVFSMDAHLPISEWPQFTWLTPVELEVPGRLTMNDGWALSAERVVDSNQTIEQALMNADPNIAWVDANKLTTPLIVRTRQPGDRFTPFGMQGHSMKLADFMVNVKMPKRARADWPLVSDGEKIIWVPGYRIGYSLRVAQQTEEIIRLSLVKKLEP